MNQILNWILKGILHNPVFFSSLNNFLLNLKLELVHLTLLGFLNVDSWFPLGGFRLIIWSITMPQFLIMDGFDSLPNVKLNSNLISMFD